MSKKRIKDLELVIQQANKDYYNDVPSMSDSAFDTLRDELKILDPNNKVLKEVGSSPSSALKKVKHKIPMGSQEKVNTPQEVSDWFNKYIPEKSVTWSEKIDGLSLSAFYKNGVLVQGVTRGDGEEGEDITHTLLKSQCPKKLKKKVTHEIRAEVYLRKSIYLKEFSDKKNPRNAAAGTLRRLDGSRSEFLEVKFYQIDMDFETEAERMEYIESLGLDTPKWGVAKSVEDIEKLWKKYEGGVRDQTDYEIDGLVLVSNSVKNQDELGVVDGRPRFARAYKFTSQGGKTIFRSIENQVGRTGIITPVGKIDKVNVAGVDITSVTLHNYKYIQEKGLKLNQEVFVERKGDVIPQITQVLNTEGDDIKVPTKCPCCKSKLEPAKDLIAIYCTNPDCAEQKIQGLLFWLEVIDVKGMAYKMVEKLFNTGKVTKIKDFYSLSVEDISSLERSGETIAKKLVQELKTKSHMEAPAFLKGFGISELGETTARLILENHKLENIFDLSAEDLIKIHGIGKITAESVVVGLKVRQKEILEMTKIVNIKKAIEGTLTGKSFCFTEVRDKDLEADLKAQGATILDGVNKTLSYLIVKNKNGTSSKLEKARKNNVEIIEIQEVRPRFKI